VYLNFFYLILFSILLPGYLQAQSIQLQKISSYSTIFTSLSGGLNTSCYEVINLVDTSGIVISGFQQVDSASTVGEQELKSDAIFRVFPNPVKDELLIQLDFEGTNRYLIRNELGQTLMEGKINKKANVNVSKLSFGIYMIFFASDEKVLGTIKFIKI
jgi:hypothetical protein